MSDPAPSARPERRDGVPELKFPVPASMLEPTLEWMRSQFFPPAARGLLEKTGLAASGFSKYRTGVRSAGLVPPDAPNTKEDNEFRRSPTNADVDANLGH